MGVPMACTPRARSSALRRCMCLLLALGCARRYRDTEFLPNMELPKRSNATDLTDNELLLFDFLFDKSLAFHHLRIEGYSFHMNCRYSHSLDDDRLRITLASLVDRRLLNEIISPIFNVETRDWSHGPRYTLTESGGDLWDRERKPDWNSFVATAHWQLGLNCRGIMRILCSDERIGRMCLGSMFNAGLVSPIGRIQVRTIWNARLLPWKTFNRVYSIRCKTNDSVNDGPVRTDWSVYNACRTWWRDIHELDSLERESR